MKKPYVFSSEEELLSDLCLRIEQIANDAIKERKIFTVGVSGSSMVKQLAETLPKICTEWSKWKFFFCDERIVPFNDEESTFGAYINAFQNKVPVTADQFVTINYHLSADDAAKDYAKKLSIYFSSEFPSFDLLLMGMGPDGHTCSLFPNHSKLDEDTVPVTAITDSPKPPANRITLTYPSINNSKNVIFLVLGASKAEAVKKIFKDNEPLPANRVNPKNVDVIWLMDKAAASLIN